MHETILSLAEAITSPSDQEQPLLESLCTCAEAQITQRLSSGMTPEACADAFTCAAALLVGLGSLFVSRTSRLNQDTALSILHTTAFAAGFIVLVRLGLQQKIDDWLFGSIMSLSDSDLWIAFAISSVSVLILLLFRRPILICLFDPDIATTLGIPSRLISYGIFTLIILVLVSSLQAVGAFLTLGLLVGPAATVYLLTNKPAHLFWGGGIIGGLGSLLAFYLSFPLGWHLGATIILVVLSNVLGKVGKPRTGKQHKETAERSAAPVPAQPQ